MYVNLGLEITHVVCLLKITPGVALEWEGQKE